MRHRPFSTTDGSLAKSLSQNRPRKSGQAHFAPKTPQNEPVPDGSGIGSKAQQFASRYSNPFATCWTKPGAIPFRFNDNQCAEQLVSQFAAQQWRGAIVGPHGSGKSTLVATLKPELRAAGFYTRATTLLDGQRCLPNGFLPCPRQPRSIVIIDGFEQLGWLDRAKLERFCRRASHGLLVTTHAPTRIPTLIRLAPHECLVQQLVAELAAQVSTQITPADVAASHACHGSNVREILFDLYDRHERLRRAARTFVVANA